MVAKRIAEGGGKWKRGDGNSLRFSLHRHTEYSVLQLIDRGRAIEGNASHRIQYSLNNCQPSALGSVGFKSLISSMDISRGVNNDEFRANLLERVGLKSCVSLENTALI